MPVERALPAILAELRGWRIAGDEVLGRALVAAGGIQARHAHVYSHDLTGERPEPHPPAGITLTPMDRPAADLLPAYLAAHPVDHVDGPVIAGEDSGRHLAGILEGSLGPMLSGSGVAVDADGRVAGAILVTRLGGAESPFGGPWVMELFRDPRDRGAGRALLERALARHRRADARPRGDPRQPGGAPLRRTRLPRVHTAFSVDL